MDILDYKNGDEDAARFTIVNDQGEEMVCDILVAFESEDTDHYYLVYTDNTVDEDGNLRVFASVCDPTADEPTLLPLQTEEEWELVEAALDDLFDEK